MWVIDGSFSRVIVAIPEQEGSFPQRLTVSEDPIRQQQQWSDKTKPERSSTLSFNGADESTGRIDLLLYGFLI